MTLLCFVEIQWLHCTQDMACMDTDISIYIHVKSVDMDMDGKFHIHGKPGMEALTIRVAGRTYSVNECCRTNQRGPLQRSRAYLCSYARERM